MSSIVMPANAPGVRIPGHLFLFAAAVSELTPFVARLPGVAAHGWEWLGSYLPGLQGLLFLSGVNLVPGLVLWGLGRAGKRWPLAFWFAVAGTLWLLFWGHGTINLRSSSTASIGLIFIPAYAAGAGLVAWLLGLAASLLLKDEAVRARAAWAVVAGAALIGTAMAVNETQTVAKRESRFPVVSVQEIPLLRTEIACCDQGRVEVLRLGRFDDQPGDEILALSDDGATLLDPGSYGVRKSVAFPKNTCRYSCIGMDPDVAPDGKGGFLVISSEGVVNAEGRLVWQLESDSFHQMVALQPSSTGEPALFAKHIHQRIERRDLLGKVLWAKDLTVGEIAPYRTADGEPLLVALVRRGNEGTAAEFYDLDGGLRSSVRLPGWAMHVQEVAWPAPGHMLVGSGPMAAVADSSGKLLFQHFIEDTSFRPYHGPQGTAVLFDPKRPPHLAVLSHGSSGYARSALLVFDPEGRLVWKEELHKVHAVLAVRRADGNGEALLLGGNRGIVEYRLGGPAQPSQ